MTITNETAKVKLLGTIDIDGDDPVWCINCDRTSNGKRVFKGGRMNLVLQRELNRYEAWCMECSLPFLEIRARELMVKIMSDKSSVPGEQKQ